MNHMKAYAVLNRCSALVTYADNDAIGYFAKQGFSERLTLEPERLGVVKVKLHAPLRCG
jgi:histone acetyltransferase